MKKSEVIPLSKKPFPEEREIVNLLEILVKQDIQHRRNNNLSSIQYDMRLDDVKKSVDYAKAIGDLVQDEAGDIPQTDGQFCRKCKKFTAFPMQKQTRANDEGDVGKLKCRDTNCNHEDNG